LNTQTSKRGNGSVSGDTTEPETEPLSVYDSVSAIIPDFDAAKAGDDAAPKSSNARRDSKMTAKTLIAAKDFRDNKNGRDYKAGDRVEVDEDYGQELIRKGEAKEDPQASQQPAKK
jgi:hypothetical protein